VRKKKESAGKSNKRKEARDHQGKGKKNSPPTVSRDLERRGKGLARIT